MRSLSPAAQRNLERVFAEEQLINARRVTWLRVGLTGLGVLAFLVVRLDLPFLTVSRVGAQLYFAVAVVIALAVRAMPRLTIASAYAVAFIDVPLLSAIHHLQLPTLEHPIDNGPANVAMMCGLIVMSALSLSWPVILSTGITALISMMWLLHKCGFNALQLALVAIVPIGLVPGCIGLVMRIRALVAQSRERDLLGKYILGERLGTGGMAEVYSATYSPEGGFERRVAVKKMLPALAEQPDAVALFRREAEVGALLSHPNLVNVLDFGSDGASFFLAMEFVDGHSLGQVLRAANARGALLDPRGVTYLLWCLADVLDYIHEHIAPTGSPLRLVHRDVNPPNILISRTGEVKLADFGIARDVNAPSLTQVGIMRGKLAYASPEQVSGQPYDHRADLFGLGATVYEALVGQRLFQAASDAALMRQCLEGAIALPSSLRPNLPVQLDALVMGLLERDLERRTPSARALTQQLSALGEALFDLRAGRQLLADAVSHVTSTSAAQAGSDPSLPRPDTTATVDVRVTPTGGT